MDKVNNQVFVRNLAFDTTNEDLMQLFQDIGPVKRASVAIDNGVAKGYGFVKFIMEEDAARAVEQLNNHPFKGRKMQLEIAVKKGQNPMKTEFFEGGEKSEDQPARKEAKVSKPPAQPRSAISLALEAKIEATNAAKAIPVENNVDTDNAIDSQKKEVAKKKKFKKVSIKDPETNDSTLAAIPKSVKPVAETRPAAKKATASTAELSRARRLLLWGIHSSIPKKEIVKVVGKFCRKCEVSIISENDPLFEAVEALAPVGKIVLISVPSRKFATKITEAFDGKSSKLFFKPTVVASSDSSQQQSPPASTSVNLMVRSLSEITEPILRKRKCRVIIRNLSFQAIEQNLSDKLSKFGPLTEVFLPRIEVSVTPKDENASKFQRKRQRDHVGDGSNGTDGAVAMKLKPRGYGFATFLCEKDALAAVSKSAGLKICNREVAIDLCASKEIYNRTLAEGSTASSGMSLEESQSAAMDSQSAVVSSEASKALSQLKDDEENADDDNETSDNDEDDDDKDDENDTKGDDDEVDKDAAVASDDNHDEYDHNKTKTSSNKVSKSDDPDADEGRTVFLRDLAFDCKQEDIKSALQEYGKILFVALVKEKDTGICKGSAFVKFRSQSEAITCVQAARDAKPALSILNRPFRADIAVDKQAAERLKAGAASSTRKDKRNLYLANEGLLVEATGTSPKSLMTNEERDKRQRAQQDKKKKLLNPLFFVSATRLSIRNLPKAVGDGDLKIMCHRAVKAGLAKKLVGPNDVAAQLIAQGEDLQAQQASNLIIPSHTVPNCVKSAKVMLDLKKLRNGVPQSRSYGFVEFSYHAHALACLRELNHSLEYVKYLPEVVQHSMLANAAESRPQRLMVEFSLENFNKVQLLKKREDDAKKRKTAVSDDGDNDDDNDDGDDDKPKGKVGSKRGREQLVLDDENNNDVDGDDNDESDEEGTVAEESEDAAPAQSPFKKQKQSFSTQSKQKPHNKRDRSTGPAESEDTPNKKRQKHQHSKKQNKKSSESSPYKPNPGALARAAQATESAEQTANRKAAKLAKRKAAETRRANKITKRQEKKMSQQTSK